MDAAELAELSMPEIVERIEAGELEQASGSDAYERLMARIAAPVDIALADMVQRDSSTAMRAGMNAVEDLEVGRHDRLLATAVCVEAAETALGRDRCIARHLG